MIAIITFFAGIIIGWGTSCLFGAKKISDCQAGESYWRQQYFLEKDSHSGTIKKYISRIKEAEKSIRDLTEENINLQDSIIYYKNIKVTE